MCPPQRKAMTRGGGPRARSTTAGVVSHFRVTRQSDIERVNGCPHTVHPRPYPADTGNGTSVIGVVCA